MTQQSNITKFGVDRLKQAAPKKSKAWSHQQQLANLKGQRLLLVLAGDKVEGTLLEADQFTLKVVHDDQSVVTYFKHAITCYLVAA